MIIQTAPRNSIVSWLWFFMMFNAISLQSLAQSNAELDSLLMELKSAKADTHQVITLCRVSEMYRDSGQQTDARTYANAALQLAEKIHFLPGRAEAYYQIGESYIQEQNYPDAISNFLAEIEIREELGNKRLTAYAYQQLAGIHLQLFNYDDALKNSLAALRLAEEIGDNELIPIYNNTVGTIYGLQANYPEALKHLLTALETPEVPVHKMGMCVVNANIGDIYMSQGNYTEAMKHYLTANQLAEEIGDKSRISIGYSNIGRINKAQGNYPEALKNFKEAFRIAKEINSRLASGGIASNELGQIYKLQGKYDEALAHFKEVLKISEEVGNKFGMSISHSNIGGVYQCTGNYPEALKNYLSAMQIAEAIGNKREIANTYNHLGILYTVLQNDLEAQQYFDKSLAISNEIGHKEGIMNAYLGLSKLDSLRGNYQAALLHYKLFHGVKDSLLNETSNKEIARLQEQYASEKKDKDIMQLTIEKQKLASDQHITVLLLQKKQDSLTIAETGRRYVTLEYEKINALNQFNLQQIELLENEKQLQQLQMDKDQANLAVQQAEADKRQEQLTALGNAKALQALELKKEKLVKNYLMAGIVLLGILTFFIYRNYRSRQEVKLLTLRNKIASDLHDDIGSTLSSISIFSQMAQGQSKEAKDALETIGESSRKMLDAMADIVWTINPVNDQFEKIIMRMRSFAYELLGARDIEFEFDADEDISNVKLSMEARKNLYLIFKEATNNMVKYADANKALFAIKEEHDKLTMLIRDNGKGFDVNKEMPGNGLRNMRKRAIEMGAKLWIDSMPGNGTTIKLELAI